MTRRSGVLEKLSQGEEKGAGAATLFRECAPELHQTFRG